MAYATPFVAALDTPAHVNKVFTLYGLVPPTSSRFGLSLQCGPGAAPPADVAFHVSVRFPENTVVFNTVQYGNWQGEEVHHRLPIHPGSQFQIIILCTPASFKIAFNGNHFAEFAHRMPLERVSHMSVEGNVQLHSISGIITAGADMVHNPSVPVMRPIEGGVFAGRLIRVRGRNGMAGGRFEINLLNGPRSVPQDDTTLHVSVRPSEGFIAFNSLRNGHWESETRHGATLHPGAPFEILILSEHDHFKIALNGAHLGEFPHRFPASFIQYVYVTGDVQLSVVSSEGQPRSGGIQVAPLGQIVSSYSSPYDGCNAHYPTPYSIY